jgi:dephospho-CoA kinase
VWLVDAPAEVRLERLVLRGLSREDARRRIETQGDIAALWQTQKIPVARIENVGSLEQLARLVHQLSLS